MQGRTTTGPSSASPIPPDVRVPVSSSHRKVPIVPRRPVAWVLLMGHHLDLRRKSEKQLWVMPLGICQYPYGRTWLLQCLLQSHNGMMIASYRKSDVCLCGFLLHTWPFVDFWCWLIPVEFSIQLLPESKSFSCHYRTTTMKMVAPQWFLLVSVLHHSYEMVPPLVHYVSD